MKAKVDKKRFVRYKEGAELYSMCQSKFEQMAKDAGAIYKLNKLVLVNCDIFEEYLETFHIKEQGVGNYMSIQLRDLHFFVDFLSDDKYNEIKS